MNDDLTDQIPRDILQTLFRGLVYGGEELTRDEIERAWAWLEQHNHHEEMGR